ncbi:NAD(P)-dependent oxidoreductase [Billgrantia tianxiuensis]|jgi:3-hydroxyisobutyrate dehydrogenase-like beta-hydroxyacid dehydrogenase|uniref:NAD(P)-dependent oxidoreductase n=1 Tax=Billgrantia tianxiuensis TaxID=2497861 RepID=A0A6I6SPP8_9GAMM|nr:MULTISPECIES: NAD(P)-dependent oxidoreductase [Halomonas]MCE8033608.1 NAD(P)-dependent oxidoreductase [Halomonas sp. MCCC 1A11057]QHC51201.1 NAD(P)-dependent oxidoreductase [Halomonas tianxiuensis]
MKQSRKVGLIGVGLMGHGIAANILRGRHALCFLDHPGNQPVEDLLDAGAGAKSSGREVAEAAEVVILCVTGSPQVEAVLFEPGGVLEGLAPGTVVIDCSTALPSSTERVAARVEAAGGRFMDAAMTRTPKEAEEGRLNLIVGASEALFAEVRPLLECFAENIAHAGPVGAGHTLKLLHNFVSLGFTAVLAEAAAASRRAGIDDAALLDVLGKGGGGGVVLERLRPYIEADDPSGFRFSVANALKDIGYYRTMTEDLAAEHGVAEAVLTLYRQASDAGHAERPVPELISLLEGK